MSVLLPDCSERRVLSLSLVIVSGELSVGSLVLATMSVLASVRSRLLQQQCTVPLEFSVEY